MSIVRTGASGLMRFRHFVGRLSIAPIALSFVLAATVAADSAQSVRRVALAGKAVTQNVSKGATTTLQTDLPYVDLVVGDPEIADAMPLSMRITDWEMRLFLRTLADRDVDKLSAPVRERMLLADAMTLADYREALATREEIRAAYTELAADCDACITLTASGAAPVGREAACARTMRGPQQTWRTSHGVAQTCAPVSGQRTRRMKCLWPTRSSSGRDADRARALLRADGFSYGRISRARIIRSRE